MSNYTGGVRVICPYYIKEADKSITCEGLMRGTTTMTRFETREEKRGHQSMYCERYDPERCCPLACILQKQLAEYTNDGNTVQNDGNTVQNDGNTVIIKTDHGIGSIVRDARRKSCMTQGRLAKLSFLSRSYIGDIEQGRYRPSLDALEMIAAALDMEVSALIGGKKTTKR